MTPAQIHALADQIKAAILDINPDLRFCLIMEIDLPEDSEFSQFFGATSNVSEDKAHAMINRVIHAVKLAAEEEKVH